MKRFKIKTGLIFASWALILVFGCHKKKPPVPTQEAPPTITASAKPPEPDTQPKTEEPVTPPPVPPEPQPTKPPEKPAPKRPKSHPVKKPTTEPDKTPPVEVAKNTVPEPPAAPAPPRIVIQEGGPNAQSGQTGTGAPGNDGVSQTQQLLDSTDKNVHDIEKRQLSPNENLTLAQIKDYVKQSKQAITDGDLVRAHNLAIKAHLLSDDLAKSH